MTDQKRVRLGPHARDRIRLWGSGSGPAAPVWPYYSWIPAASYQPWPEQLELGVEALEDGVTALDDRGAGLDHPSQ
ncbi:hypothetical protein JK2ML_0679 [Mycobacterium leprae Kyoto-2]|uniref:Uncharacterized protein n=3 Tax=Mycobacterium leprae TaxID=1769 RepID=Q9CCM3_MYCLE|nr:hypothetical protein [Mycobacterium leprae]CAR70773.1 hypothetical protein MLBr00679 [Mycobacterium leprae Br4923]BBC16712.1 hypothetical protein JK2ML_0679 [Mycobacterium leprae Kyoto-2]AWV47515.1 hypothetical protein DIJ64_03695 [Mycobacterium leprae]OAR21709.1 hypothetical protein A8144_00400 [Mycobacterium leprae 3125609]OAX72247.1 hypothetical protein A3216_00460 [Mycobacterium leprae 7935681]